MKKIYPTYTELLWNEYLNFKNDIFGQYYNNDIVIENEENLSKFTNKIEQPKKNEISFLKNKK